jgi:hypothetical protein
VVYGLIIAGAWFLGKRVASRFVPEPLSAKYPAADFELVYPGFTREQREALLKETWNRPYVTERYTEFKERPFQGEYVNVDPAGFRKIKNQAPWPPKEGDESLFVFGGSTVFGYGLPDDRTVPSFLQERLSASHSSHPPRVYNFGRGYYTLSRERVLYEELLIHGYVPKIAVFIDGLNEFTTDPPFTRELDAWFDKHESASGGLGEALPSPLPSLAPKNLTAEAILDRYLTNKRLIEATSQAFGIRVLFVWQPIPFYEYDPKANPFQGGSWLFREAPRGFTLMHDRVPEMGDDFLWAADLQRGLHEPLYVDAAHYGEKLSRLLAVFIADALDKKHS